MVDGSRWGGRMMIGARCEMPVMPWRSQMKNSYLVEVEWIDAVRVYKVEVPRSRLFLQLSLCSTRRMA